MKIKILGAVVASVLAIATSANAATIKVSWSGIVINDNGNSGVAIGDTITGMYTYDDTTPDSGTGAPGFFSVYETNHVSSFSLNGLTGSILGSSIFVFDNGISGDRIYSIGSIGVTCFCPTV